MVLQPRNEKLHTAKHGMASQSLHTLDTSLEISVKLTPKVLLAQVPTRGIKLATNGNLGFMALETAKMFFVLAFCTSPKLLF